MKQRPFGGFQAPFYTMVPNELLDNIMVDLTGAELRVVLYVCRRTFGFGKTEDGIALMQLMHGLVSKDGRRLDRGCGIKSKTTLLQTLRSLVEQRILVAVKRVNEVHGGSETTVYRLNLMKSKSEVGGGTKTVPPPGPVFDPGGGPEIVPPGGPEIVPPGGPEIVPPGGPEIVPPGGPKIAPTKERKKKSMERKHHPAAVSAGAAAGVAGDDDDVSRTALTGDGVLNGLVERMLALGLSPRLAWQYVAEHPAERIGQALDRLPHRKAQNPVGYFIAELRAGDFVAPPVVAQGEQEASKVRALQARMETDQAAEMAIAARVQDALEGLSEGDRAALWAEARLQVARQSRRAVEDVAEDSPWVLGTFEHLVEVRYCGVPRE
jgi:hypothetical protein